MHASTRFPRRSFLRSVATLGAVSAIAPTLLRARAANGQVNVAFCGIGNRGAQVFKAIQQTGLSNVVALCDTDMGAPHTQEVLQQAPQVPRFQDFRRMFDQMGRQIDAVVVATPDFSHFPIAMLAMSLGKHVYCEKPMGQTFRQIELMMRAEKKYKVAAQMGNQGHSEANYHQFKAWVDAGIIKNVTKITAFMNNPRRWHGMKVSGPLPKQPVPASLDWETWLATAEERDYNVGYINGEWRSWFDLGNGALGDWGAHIFDTAHEFLQLGMPTEVAAVKLDGHSPFIFPQASTLAFRFPARGKQPPVELMWYDGQENLPPLPPEFSAPVVDANVPPPSKGPGEGKVLPPGKVIYSDELTFQGGSHATTLKIIPEAKALDLANKLPQVPATTSNHFENFLLACQGEEQCRSPFAVAGPLCQVMALGVIAQRLNTTLAFDPKSRKITNVKAANQLLDGEPPRKGWAQYYKL